MILSHNKSLGLLILRLFVGIVFIYSGYEKLVHMDMIIGYFASIGLASFWAYVVAWVELIGGISVLVGYGSKVAATLLSIIMIVATYTTFVGMGINAAGYPFITLGASLALLFTGSGKYSFGSHCGCPVKQGTCSADGCKECGADASAAK